MKSKQFIGQQRWQTYFEDILLRGRYAHAYLFSGPRHLGKRTFVGILSRAILCNERAGMAACGRCFSCLLWRGKEHPDLARLGLLDQATSIGVKEVRDFAAAIGKTPFVAKERAVVIENLEDMTIEGANALLKILEEPPARTVLFLIAESAARLPATVCSRLYHCLFTPVPRRDLVSALVSAKIDRARAAELAALANGRPGLVWSWLENPKGLKAYQDRGAEFIKLCRGSLKERFSFVEYFLQNSGVSLAECKKLLSHWRLVVRDFLVLRANEPALISHTFLRPDLNSIALDKELSGWLAFYDAAERTEQIISRNANRRLAFNNLLLTL